MSCRRPVTPHFSSSSPKRRAYARMAASTASMCLRKESLSVHSHMRSQASSLFTACPTVSPFGRWHQASGSGRVASPEEGSARGQKSGNKRGSRTLPTKTICSLMPVVFSRNLSFVRHLYDAAGGVRLLDGAGGFAGGQDDLEVTLLLVPFLDAAGESLPSRVELEALGDLPAEHLLRRPHRAEAGERRLGGPFQPDNDGRLVPGFAAQGDLRRLRILGRLEHGGRRGSLLRQLGFLLRGIFGRSILLATRAGRHEEQHDDEQGGRRQDRTNSFGLDGTHERAF